jgi:DNA mismatch endonuclease, patch repair protein
MVDHLNKSARSINMSKIRSTNTNPEMIVRTMLYNEGFRYRLHVKGLPGTPDIVLTKYHSIIFVHGCFWHHHKKCKRSNMPKSNVAYWSNKISRNELRDRKNIILLKSSGWKVFVVWECETKNTVRLRKKLTALLKGSVR